MSGEFAIHVVGGEIHFDAIRLIVHLIEVFESVGEMRIVFRASAMYPSATYRFPFRNAAIFLIIGKEGVIAFGGVSGSKIILERRGEGYLHRGISFRYFLCQELFGKLCFERVVFLFHQVVKAISLFPYVIDVALSFCLVDPSGGICFIVFIKEVLTESEIVIGFIRFQGAVLMGYFEFEGPIFKKRCRFLLAIDEVELHGN